MIIVMITVHGDWNTYLTLDIKRSGTTIMPVNWHGYSTLWRLLSENDRKGSLLLI